jgi:hypothetical protein
VAISSALLALTLVRAPAFAQGSARALGPIGATDEEAWRRHMAESARRQGAGGARQDDFGALLRASQATTADALINPEARVRGRVEVDADADGRMDVLYWVEPWHCPGVEVAPLPVMAYNAGGRWVARVLLEGVDELEGAVTWVRFVMLRGAPLIVTEWTVRCFGDCDDYPHYAFFRAGAAAPQAPVAAFDGITPWAFQGAPEGLRIREGRRTRTLQWDGSTLIERPRRRGRRAPQTADIIIGAPNVAPSGQGGGAPPSAPSHACVGPACPTVPLLRSVGLPGAVYTADVAAAPDGGLYVAGSFRGTLELGSRLAAGTSTQGFIARLAADGSPRWVRRLAGSQSAYAEALALGQDGRVCVAGAYEGTGDVGPSPLANAGAHDVFVMCFTAEGNPIWARHFGNAADDRVHEMRADAAGNLVLRAEAVGRLDVLASPSPDAARGSPYLLDLSAEGEPRWARWLAWDTGVDENVLAVSDDGSVYVAGGPPDVPEDPSAPLLMSRRLLLTALRSDGTTRWAYRGRSRCQLSATTVAATGDGVAVAGSATGPADFGALHLDGNVFPSASGSTHPSTFLVSLSSEGQAAWVRGFDGGGERVRLTRGRGGDLYVVPAFGGLLTVFSSSGTGGLTHALWPPDEPTFVHAVASTSDGAWVTGGHRVAMTAGALRLPAFRAPASDASISVIPHESYVLRLGVPPAPGALPPPEPPPVASAPSATDAGAPAHAAEPPESVTSQQE